MNKIDIWSTAGWLIGLAIVIFWVWSRFFSNKEPNPATQTSNSSYSASTYQSTPPVPQQNNPPKYTSPTDANLNDVETEKPIDLQSLIESCDITFDENFAPIATIKVHNTTGKRIDQMLFRFTFTNYDRANNLRIGLIEDSENSSYVNVQVMLTPPDYKTVTIQIPDPKRKNIDKPNVYVTKIRYYDGSIETDER